MTIFHLLNDFSGSTSIINDLLNFNKKKIKVVTSKSVGRINLSNIKSYNDYIYVSSFWRKVFMLLKVYSKTAYYCLFSEEKIILSTILFAPVALLIRKKNISLYLMEMQHGPKFIFKFLIFLLRNSSVKIYVLSNYMKTELNLPKSLVLYPSLREEFQLANIKSLDSSRSNVLFVASFKKYKGWLIFTKVSNLFNNFKFKMILSHQENNDPIISDFKGRVLFNEKNMVPFLKESDIVCNLSIPSQWKETLGLTILEAMSLGKIVICPKAGAFTEYIVDGENGFLLHDVNALNFEICLNKISKLSPDQITKIKINAIKTAEYFEYNNRQLLIQKEIL